MRTKILSFIYSRKNQKWLLLKNNGDDPIHGGEKWFTVTGSVEPEDKSLEDAVARELLEEINQAPIKIINLNTKSKYFSEYDKEDCLEHNFLSIVNSDKVTLDTVENTDYLWVDLDEYIEKIWWLDDKQILKEQLENEIKNLDITAENIDNTYLPYGSYVEVYILNENKEFIVIFSAEDNCNVLSGKVKDDESFENAAIRVAKEKINAEIKVIDISKSGSDKEKIVIAKLDPPFQRLKIQADEISGYKWINKEQIYNYLENLDQWISAEKVFKEFKEYF